MKTMTMFSLHRLIRFIPFFSMMIFVMSCMKTAPSTTTNNNPGGNSNGDTTPAVTEVGDPIGDPVTVNIGPAGGSITSEDGRVQLTIPAGALAANTDISIQPIVNFCPGGIGLAYDLLPNGTKFTKAATLTFHYTDDDMNGTSPWFCYIAFQDSLLQWESDLKNCDFDTSAKTMSLDISHFTSYAGYTNIKLNANPLTYYENENGLLAVSGDKRNVGAGTSNPVEASLSRDVAIDNSLVQSWTVRSGDGTISGAGATAIYTAPSSIPNERSIIVSVKIGNPATRTWRYRSGLLIEIPANQFTLTISLRLRQAIYNFHVRVSYKAIILTDPKTFITDTSEFDVSVNKLDVTFPTTATNTRPKAQPPSFAYGLGCTYTTLLDDNGMINVTVLVGHVGDDPVTHKTMLEIIINEEDLYLSGFQIKCPDGSIPDRVDPPLSTPVGQLVVKFVLKNEGQTIGTTDISSQESYKYELDPK